MKKHLHLLDHLALPTTPGQHHDGGGLYLVISPTGAMSWVYRYKIAGVERRKGLGAYPAVGVAQARKEARRCRDLRDAGIDPVDAGKADRAADKAAFLERIAGERAEREAARQAEERETAERAIARAERHARKVGRNADRQTARARKQAARALKEAKAQALEQSCPFAVAANRFLALHQAKWRNKKHREQWTNTLRRYVYPVFGRTPFAKIDTDLVLEVLEPMWLTKHPTARRVRERIENILDAWAVRERIVNYANPARAKGHLDHVLPVLKKRRVRHHAAIDYHDVPAFFAELRAEPGRSARALELVILTVARTGDIIGQDGDDETPPLAWPHVFLRDRIWKVPRVKNDTLIHRVPLAAPALEILAVMGQPGGVAKRDGWPDKVKPISDRTAPAEGIVFESSDARGEPLSNGAMLALLKRMGYAGESTVHGFRSCFETWAVHETSSRRDIIDCVMTHGTKSKLGEAYQRGDLLKLRAELMEQWAEFVTSGLSAPAAASTGGANVVPLDRRKRNARSIAA